jgi:hypothetical protein
MMNMMIWKKTICSMCPSTLENNHPMTTPTFCDATENTPIPTMYVMYRMYSCTILRLLSTHESFKFGSYFFKPGVFWYPINT